MTKCGKKICFLLPLPIVNFGGFLMQFVIVHCSGITCKNTYNKNVKCTMHNNNNIHGNCAIMRRVAIVHVCCAPIICCACKYNHCEINYCACCTFLAPLLCTIQVLCMQDSCTLHKHCIPVA